MCWTEDRDVAVFDMEGTRRDLGQHRRSPTKETCINERLRLTFRLSDLLMVVALCAILISALTLGTWAAWGGVILCSFAAIAQLISAIVGRNLHRAKAIGFLVPAVLYFLCTVFVSDNDYSYRGALLPNSQLMQKRIWQELERAEDAGFKPNDVQVFLQRTTTPHMALAHLLSACVVGYIGSRYAAIVFLNSQNGS